MGNGAMAKMPPSYRAHPRLYRLRHANEHRECLLSATLRKSHFSAVRAVVDPSATLAVHRGNGFDADFSPYQSTRLSR
jgi:hypothetical protein